MFYTLKEDKQHFKASTWLARMTCKFLKTEQSIAFRVSGTENFNM